MFGKLISSALKVATLPLDAANIAMDVVTGGDGSKASRTSQDNPNPGALAENIRDKIADAAESIDT